MQRKNRYKHNIIDLLATGRKDLNLSCLGIENTVIPIKLDPSDKAPCFGLFFLDIDYTINNDDIKYIKKKVPHGDLVLLNTTKGHHVISFMLRDPYTTGQTIRETAKHFNNPDYGAYAQIVLRFTPKYKDGTAEHDRPVFNKFIRYPEEKQLTSATHILYYGHILGKGISKYKRTYMIHGNVRIYHYRTK